MNRSHLGIDLGIDRNRKNLSRLRLEDDDNRRMSSRLRLDDDQMNRSHLGANLRFDLLMVPSRILLDGRTIVPSRLRLDGS